MKVIIKCGDERFLPEKVEKFFLGNILSVLDSEIAIELTTNAIFVYNKKSMNRCLIDQTVEIIVELTEEARAAALDENVSIEALKDVAGKYFDEALAIRKIEELSPPFSREYYSCNYRRGRGDLRKF